MAGPREHYHYADLRPQSPPTSQEGDGGDQPMRHGGACQHQEQEKYWTHDVAQCVRSFDDDPTEVMAAVHMNDGSLRRSVMGCDIETLTSVQGTRTYQDVRPY